jgi:hypothetical protein
MWLPLWSLGPPAGEICHQEMIRPSPVTDGAAWCQTGDAEEASSPKGHGGPTRQQTSCHL